MAAAMIPMLQALRLMGLEVAADCGLLGCFFTCDGLNGLRTILVLGATACHTGHEGRLTQARPDVGITGC
jgi:hypothetical protein